MSRNIDVPVYVGVMKSTENSEKPVTCVMPEPYTGSAFNQYTWYRTTVPIMVASEIKVSHHTSVEEVAEDTRCKRD
jgi:hypothetical protein